MYVGVTLFGPHARLLPLGSEGGRVVLQMKEPPSVAQVLDILEVPEEGRSYVTVNGERVDPATVVSEADEIRVIVPLGGG